MNANVCLHYASSNTTSQENVDPRSTCSSAASSNANLETMLAAASSSSTVASVGVTSVLSNATSTSSSSSSSSSFDNVAENPQQGFQNHLAQSLFETDSANAKILTFKNKAPRPTEGFDNQMRVIYSQNKQGSILNGVKRTFRHISPTPERILDAPELLDDYYLNLLDWSSSNKLAVALGTAVYMWSPTTGEIDMLLDTAELVQQQQTDAALVTSLSWMGDGSHLAIGTSTNDVQLWNVERKKQVRSMKGHLARVGSLAWNGHILSSGSRDSMIFNHDVRIAQHLTSTLRGHEQEICGLKWSPDGSQLASGSNDNTCCIWDAGMSTARHVFSDSAAAVKALAWCPWQKNLLATGSGTADRHIRFYDTVKGVMVNKIDTASQVCSLQWSLTEKELLSSHGFSQNQLTVWKYPSLVKVADLTGHSSRVLHTAVSPDGTVVCSAAADETLRFWRVWESAAQKQAKRRRAAEEASAGAISVSAAAAAGSVSGKSSSMMSMKIR